ncbi:MAG: polyprenol monophosphomannose synthase [Saprospiraceae bacterium]|nr:polyprenol monophosphomannose synthase [Saprospiraceae bacterium]
MSDSLVIIPTYNEIENINSIVSAVMELEVEFEVLVVDDGSPDGTAQEVVELIKRYPGKIHLLERTEKSGLGTAYIAGFKWALKRKYEYILEMDADFSHPPFKLIELRAACALHLGDVAVGSRYIKGGGVVNWPFLRLALSRGASLYVRTITGMKVMDPTAGFVCYKREVLENIHLENIRFVGYAFQIEMKYRSYQKGYKIVEIPILFPDRVKGKSKMNIWIIREALWGVFQMRLKT